MNHKAELIDWDSLTGMIDVLQAQERWDDLLLVSLATFTGCRPSDWTMFTWSVFMDKNGDVKEQISIIEKKPLHIMQAKGKKSVPRQIFIVPRFKQALTLCWEGLGKPDIKRFMFRGGRGPKRDGISTNSANTRIKGLTAEFGLPYDTTNYWFRKTGGRKVYDAQTDQVLALRMAQRFYNHHSSATTMKYIGLLDEETKQAFSNLNF